MKNRNCSNCKNANKIGQYKPATFNYPEEFPDVECNLEGEQADEFFETLNFFRDMFESLEITGNEEQDKKVQEIIIELNSLDMAKYCPFYEEE